MTNQNCMNVLYCIDETKKDFSRFLWVSILSLLENNINEKFNIYIITTKLEKANKEEIERIVWQYNAHVYFSSNDKVIPDKIENIIYKNQVRPIATYYRLFFNNCFPEIKDRLLYLDCDTIINKNLSNFYNSNFDNNVIIWWLDIPITRYTSNKRLWTKFDGYINAWVLLINVPLFLRVNMFKWIKDANEKYLIKYCDQDYINIIFKWKILMYDSLQTIVTSKFDKNIENSLVIHTVAKPWHPLSQCPSKIIKIFDNYLEKTKRKDFYKDKKISIYGILNYVYVYLQNLIIYISYKVFWLSFAVMLNEKISHLWENIWKIKKNFFK